MVAQVRCLILIRGLKKSCDKIRKEMGFEEEHIEKETNHYRMICSDYYPCDMLLEFSFEDLANEFSVDISYLFCKFDDQLCEYNEDYNLDSFLDFNGLSTSGSVHGFKKETGIVDDLKILNDFLISERNTDSQCGNADLIFMRALQALGEYNEQLIRDMKFVDKVSVTGYEGATAGFPRVRLAAEAGDVYAKILLENYEKAKLF